MLKVQMFPAVVLLMCPLNGVVSAQEAMVNSERQSSTVGTAGPRASNMPLEAQIAEGQAIVVRGDRLSARVSNTLEAARKDADIIRITCLNAKLTQINANLRNAQKRLEALSAAVNSDKRNHEFTVLTVIGQKLQALDQESNQCIGQDIFETGATRVETDIDTAIVPNEDPTKVFEIPPAVPTITTIESSPI